MIDDITISLGKGLEMQTKYDKGCIFEVLEA